MEKLISINVDIKVHDKEKLKRIIKVSLLAAAGIAALVGALSISLFYNSGFSLYLLMFTLVFASAFCVSAAVRASIKRNAAAALCGIPIGVFAAIYQVEDILSRGSNRFDTLIIPCVAAAVACVSAAAVNAIVSGLLIKKQ